MSANENLTIVFTDIVNYTELTAGQSRAEAQAMLRRHDELLLPFVNAYHGRRIKTIGDAMLLSFRSPTDAVHCGMALQDALADARRNDAAYAELHIRVAINLGEVRAERGDVYGEPVNIAARVEGITPADEVYFTEAVYLAMNKAEVPSESVGEHRLKGIPDAIHVYRVPRFQFSRLVASGPSEAAEADLPFAGAHLRRGPVPRANDRMRSRLQQLLSSTQALPQQLRRQLQRSTAVFGTDALQQLWRQRRQRLALAGLGAALLGLLLAIGLWPTVPEGGQAEKTPAAVQPVSPAAAEVSSFRTQAETALRNGALDTLERLIKQRTDQKSDEAVALLMRGHLGFARGRSAMAMTDYATAVRIEPELASDEQLATNLVEALSLHQSQAMPLILEFPSEAVLAALARRSGQPGYRGRTLAISALEELGQPGRIDRFNHALEELKGRSRCADRLKAVELLRELQNPAALPALREARGQGLNNWWKNRCLRGLATETIAELEKIAAEPAPTDAEPPQRFSRGG